MPYDFKGCLAHMDITYNATTFDILRIKGLLQHNEECCSQFMQKLPPVPSSASESLLIALSASAIGLMGLKFQVGSALKRDQFLNIGGTILVLSASLTSRAKWSQVGPQRKLRA